MKTKFEVEPWPSYDQQGEPWWKVRIVSGPSKLVLSWSSRQGRFARDHALLSIWGRTRILAEAERVCREAVGPHARAGGAA